MKWLPKERRNPFIVVVLITAAAISLIYFGLIRSQHDTLARIAKSRESAAHKLQEIQTTIKNANVIAGQLTDATNALAHAEGDMASGDLYAWTYATIRLFKQQYKVEIPDIGHPAVQDVDLLDSFPYKQVRFSITGKAFFHDLGKFVADFENAFPHARMENLVIAPNGDGEQISFTMEIVAIIKPDAA